MNQYTAVGGATFTNDTRGNLTSDGVRTFSYDLENRLTDVDAATDLALTYDPLGRLRTTNNGTATTTFLHSGDQLVAEYNGATLLRRYAFGAGVDRPITWYEGSGLTTRNWLHSDELGSVIATSNNSGVATIYSYGPYGEPDTTNGWTGSRFRYTGQIMLPEAQLYHYKARVYEPRLGRFLQTDPVGYEEDLNLYLYVANDPMSQGDPTGQQPPDDSWRPGHEERIARARAGSPARARRPDWRQTSTGQVARAVSALGEIRQVEAGLTDAMTHAAAGSHPNIGRAGSRVLKAESNVITWAGEVLRAQAEYDAGAPLGEVVSGVAGRRMSDAAATAIGSRVGFIAGEIVAPEGGGYAGAVLGGLAGPVVRDNLEVIGDASMSYLDNVIMQSTCESCVP